MKRFAKRVVAYILILPMFVLLIPVFVVILLKTINDAVCDSIVWLVDWANQ